MISNKIHVACTLKNTSISNKVVTTVKTKKKMPCNPGLIGIHDKHKPKSDYIREGHNNEEVGKLDQIEKGNKKQTLANINDLLPLPLPMLA